jgi:hypothetical protein
MLCSDGCCEAERRSSRSSEYSYTCVTELQHCTGTFPVLWMIAGAVGSLGLLRLSAYLVVNKIAAWFTEEKRTEPKLCFMQRP